MSKNQVQFQPDYSLLELFDAYDTEDQCKQFNRRFQLEDMLPRFVYVALRIPNRLRVAGNQDNFCPYRILCRPDNR